MDELGPIVADSTEAWLCLAWWPLIILAFAMIFVVPLATFVLAVLAFTDRWLLTLRIRRRRPMPMLGWGAPWKAIGPEAIAQSWRVLTAGSQLDG